MILRSPSRILEKKNFSPQQTHIKKPPLHSASSRKKIKPTKLYLDCDSRSAAVCIYSKASMSDSKLYLKDRFLYLNNFINSALNFLKYRGGHVKLITP